MFVYYTCYISIELRFLKKIDANKTSKWKECDTCDYWYILDKGLIFQLNVCNESHGLLIMPFKLRNITVSNIKRTDYWLLLA